MDIHNTSQVMQYYKLNNNSAVQPATSASALSNSALSHQTADADKVTISENAYNAEQKLQEIAAKYDPTNMSQNELAEMTSQLRLNGLITPQESLAMLAPPSRYFDPDEKYDTLSLAKKSVAFDQSLGNSSNSDAKLRASVLEVLETLQQLSVNNKST